MSDSPSGSRLAVFAGVEDAQQEYVPSRKFVADFVVADQQAAYLAPGEFPQALAEPRAGGNSLHSCHDVAHGERGGSGADRFEEIVEPDEVRPGAGGPA